MPPRQWLRTKLLAVWAIIGWVVFSGLWGGCGRGVAVDLHVENGAAEFSDIQAEVEKACGGIRPCTVAAVEADALPVGLQEKISRKFPHDGCAFFYEKRIVKIRSERHSTKSTCLVTPPPDSTVRSMVSTYLPRVLRHCSVQGRECVVEPVSTDFVAGLMQRHFRVQKASGCVFGPPNPPAELFTPLHDRTWRYSNGEATNFLLLAEPGSKWAKHLATNLTSQRDEGFLPQVTTLHPPETVSDFTRLVDAVSSSHVFVAPYSSEFLPLLRYLPEGGIVVCLSPRGMGYTDAPSWVEELAVRSKVQLLNTRNYQDSVQKTSVAKYAPRDPIVFAKDEVKKLAVEVRVALEINGGGRGPTEDPGKDEEREYTEVDWYLPRTKFDPDHFSLGPVSITNGVITLYNKSKLEGQGGDAGLMERQSHNTTLKESNGFAFGFFRENDRHYYPAVNTTSVPHPFTTASCDETHPTVYIHYPWVRDNIYHSHNDNLWPLYLSTLVAPTPRPRRLLLLKTRRPNKPVSAYEDLLSVLFDSWDWYPYKSRETVCISRLVWGRPRRLFSTKWQDVSPYIAARVVERWREFVHRWAAVQPVLKRTGNTGLAATWLDRKPPGKRVLTNSNELLKELNKVRVNTTRGVVTVKTTKCCDGLSFKEQVVLMAGTDILIGTHGAGLLHIAYLRPGNVVAHLMPPRMNYHEQLIIERMAHAGKVHYLNTHLNTPPERRGQWNADSYSVPSRDFPPPRP